MKRVLFSAIAAFGLLAANVQAAVIVSPISASATSEFSGSFDIGNTIDQSGLFSGFTSGVTDFDTYLGTDPQHDFIAANNEWFTATDVLSAVIDYDLGALRQIDRMAFWNDEFSGVGSIEVEVSTDNVAFTSVASGLSPTNWASTVTSYGADVFSLGGVHDAQYVRLTVSNCPQADALGPFCGIGEVAFSSVASTVPEPAALLLLGAGLAGLGITRSRRARGRPEVR